MVTRPVGRNSGLDTMGLGTRFGRRSAPLRPASDVSGHPTSWTAESGCLGSEAVSLGPLIAAPGSIRSVCPAGRRRGHHFGYFRAEREDFFSRWRLDLVKSRVGKGSHWAVCTIHCACNSSPKSEKLSHRPETIQKGRRPSAKRQNWAPDHREKIVDIFHVGDRDARSVRRTHVKPLRHTSDTRNARQTSSSLSTVGNGKSERHGQNTVFPGSVKARFISNYISSHTPLGSSS